MLEEANDFTYLGSFVSADSNIAKENATRIGIPAQASDRITNIWKFTAQHAKTKLNICRSNVRPVQLYVSEIWRTNMKTESQLRGFEGRCLMRILSLHPEQ